MIFAHKLIIKKIDDPCPIFLNVANHKISSITIKSCTISIPILNLPDVDSSSSLSHKSFNTTIVLLNANPIARNIEVIASNHTIVATRYHNHPVIVTCNTHAMTDIFPRSLMIVGFNSIPTIKSNKAIPRFPND